MAHSVPTASHTYPCLPEQAAATAPAVLALAGDIEPAAVSQAQRNAAVLACATRCAATSSAKRLDLHGALRAAEAATGLSACIEGSAWHYERRVYSRVTPGGGCNVVQWSAMKLPLRAGCVDVCVIDLPFGRAHKAYTSHGGVRLLLYLHVAH